MSIWSNPGKAIKGAVNKYIPGGSRLTGDAKRRQKRLYNAAKDNYNNEAREAQSEIERLSNELMLSKSNLHSLEQAKYQTQYKGQQLEGTIRSFANSLHQLEGKRAQLGAEGHKLQASFTAFRNKIPELEGNISDLERLPADFEQLFNSIKEQKESLKGLSSDEASGKIKKHKLDVENLKQKRSETENRIREQLSSITGKHTGLSRDKEELESKLTSYRQSQENLQYESDNIGWQRNQVQQMLQNYKNEATSINSSYQESLNKTKALSSNLESYVKNAQGRLDGLSEHLNWRTGKYRAEANRTGIVQGLGLAALTFGAGMGLGSLGLSTLGSAVKYASPLVGMMRYSGTSNIEHKLQNIEKFDLRDIMGDLPSMGGSSYNDLMGQKVNIPELGGLKQSMEHFNMPSVPRLKDLPTLADSLGKIVSPEDIKNLTLGLPQMSSASGRKYSYGVLYDSDFLSKLKQLSKKVGMSYLNRRNMQTGNMQSNTQSQGGLRGGLIYG